MTVSTITKLLKQYHLLPKHGLGQNFLLDETVLLDMIDQSGLSADQTVLEIGPGIGTLTEQLLLNCHRVLAIEKDRSFKHLLADMQSRYSNLHYEFGDILNFDILSAIGQGVEYRVIANIPYYITGKIIQKFLSLPRVPLSLTILVQKEVAKNVVAKAGQMNLLGLSVQLKATAHIIRQVPATSFYPIPKVDSAVLHIDLIKRPELETYNEKVLFRLAKACFSGKRKQLHNTLAANLQLGPDQVKRLLQAANCLPTDRPQQLSIYQWVAMSQEFLKLKN